MKQQYIHTSSYVRTWSCYNPNDLQQQCQLKVVYDNLKKKKPLDKLQKIVHCIKEHYNILFTLFHT